MVSWSYGTQQGFLCSLQTEMSQLTRENEHEQQHHIQRPFLWHLMAQGAALLGTG